MPEYNVEARFLGRQKKSDLSDPVLDSMWTLFVQIGRFWENVENSEPMKSQFLAFLANRIQTDANYVNYYLIASGVIEELNSTLKNPDEVYQKLFTDTSQDNTANSFGITRKYVVKEFISLQLALGGFKSFGSPLNYPGYFGGANIEGQPPYRTYPDQDLTFFN